MEQEVFIQKSALLYTTYAHRYGSCEQRNREFRYFKYNNQYLYSHSTLMELRAALGNSRVISYNVLNKTPQEKNFLKYNIFLSLPWSFC